MKALTAIAVAVILAFGIWMAANTTAASTERVQTSKNAAAAAQTKAKNDAAAAALWSK